MVGVKVGLSGVGLGGRLGQVTRRQLIHTHGRGRKEKSKYCHYKSRKKVCMEPERKSSRESKFHRGVFLPTVIGWDFNPQDITQSATNQVSDQCYFKPVREPTLINTNLEQPHSQTGITFITTGNTSHKNHNKYMSIIYVTIIYDFYESTLKTTVKVLGETFSIRDRKIRTQGIPTFHK
jgi:hypothetical protein